MKKSERDAKSTLRACFDLELTHLRMGDWRDARGSEVTFLGNARDLHGVVCTCCTPRWERAA